jgi:hypothetical protein
MNLMKINISFTDIKAMDKKCSMSLSKSFIFNNKVTNKRNEGFGEESGDNAIFLNNKQWVDDQDVIDSDSSKMTIL